MKRKMLALFSVALVNMAGSAPAHGQNYFPDSTLPNSNWLNAIAKMLKESHEPPLASAQKSDHRLYRLVSKHSFRPPVFVFVDVTSGGADIVAKKLQPAAGKADVVAERHLTSTQAGDFEKDVRALAAKDSASKSAADVDDGSICLYEIAGADGYHAVLGTGTGLWVEKAFLQLVPQLERKSSEPKALDTGK